MIEEYMTTKEVAEALHVTRHDIFYHVKKGHIPALPILSSTGRNNSYLILKADVEKFRTEYLERPPKKPKAKKKPKEQPTEVLHLFEIILISCGTVHVLFKTCNHREFSRRYIELVEHGHHYIRARLDGVQLTIHDSDKLANVYHPRVKGACNE